MSSKSALAVSVQKIQNFFVGRSNPDWYVLSDPDSLDDMKKLPHDIAYILAIHPSRHAQIKNLLSRKCGIAIAKQNHIPNRVLESVENISRTQEGTLFPWLEDLLKNNITPPRSIEDIEQAEALGVDLQKEIELLKDFHNNSHQVSFIQSPGAVIAESDPALSESLRGDMRALHALETAGRIAALRNRLSSWHFALSLFGLLLLIPIIQIFLWLSPSAGLFSAVFTPFIVIESQRLYQSYKYGAANWQLQKKILKIILRMILMAVFCLASLWFIGFSQNALAGLFFGLAFCLLSVNDYWDKISDAKHGWESLHRQGKTREFSRWPWLKAHDGPSWWIRPLGFLTSLLLSMFFFNAAAGQNPWILALLVLSPIFIFQTLGIWHRQFISWRFTRSVSRKLKLHIIT